VNVLPLKAKHAQDAGYPDINIIAEKVAAEGQTRFEDRYRLPIGISVNMTSYSGKLLTAALYNPRLIMVYAQARLAQCTLIGSQTDHTQGTCCVPCIPHNDKRHTTAHILPLLLLWQRSGEVLENFTNPCNMSARDIAVICIRMWHIELVECALCSLSALTQFVPLRRWGTHASCQCRLRQRCAERARSSPTGSSWCGPPA